MLVDNDTGLEIIPSNVDTNLYTVNRTVKGYTLLGWTAEKRPDNRPYGYELSFLGRTYQILHPCRMQKDEFYRYDTTVCENTGASEFVAKHEKSRFFRPNAAHLLARRVTANRHSRPVKTFLNGSRFPIAGCFWTSGTPPCTRYTVIWKPWTTSRWKSEWRTRKTVPRCSRRPPARAAEKWRWSRSCFWTRITVSRKTNVWHEMCNEQINDKQKVDERQRRIIEFFSQIFASASKLMESCSTFPSNFVPGRLNAPTHAHRVQSETCPIWIERGLLPSSVLIRFNALYHTVRCTTGKTLIVETESDFDDNDDLKGSSSFVL